MFFVRWAQIDLLTYLLTYLLSVMCDCCVVRMLVAVFTQWEADHGPASAWQLIEPVDGFHPNQVQPVNLFACRIC